MRDNLKRLVPACWLGVFGLTTGCGEDPSYPAARGESDAIAFPSGFPFVRWAIPISDLCPPIGTCPVARHPPPGASKSAVRQPKPGVLCHYGEVGDGGIAAVVLAFTEAADDNTILSPFDARARGITELQVDFESPPSSGVGVEGVILSGSYCPDDLRDCRTGGFGPAGSPDATEPLVFDQPGTARLPFSSFKHFYPDEVPFDTSALDAFLFWVASGLFDYCLSNFKFVDKDGNEVIPP